MADRNITIKQKTSSGYDTIYPKTTPAQARSLSISGGVLSGPLTLNSDPVNALDAATKQYVDTSLQSGLKIDFLTSVTFPQTTLTNTRKTFPTQIKLLEYVNEGYYIIIFKIPSLTLTKTTSGNNGISIQFGSDTDTSHSFYLWKIEANDYTTPQTWNICNRNLIFIPAPEFGSYGYLMPSSSLQNPIAFLVAPNDSSETTQLNTNTNLSFYASAYGYTDLSFPEKTIEIYGIKI